MSNEVDQLIQAYRNISTNNNELISLATREINDLLSDPSIIDSLLYIIENFDEDPIRMQAATSLKLAVIAFDEQFSVEEKEHLLELILKCLSNENFEVIQNILFDIIHTLLSEDTFSIIFSFIQNSSLDSLNARLVISFPDCYIQQLLPLLEPLITKLIDSDINGVLLGLRIRPYIDPSFFLQIFQKAVDMSIHFSNETNYLVSIINGINENIEYIEDKSFIIDLYLPLIGSEDLEIPPSSQVQYSTVISKVINLIDISDTQTMFSILQKYFDLYSLLDENHDIFDFIETFASNSEFFENFISKLQDTELSENVLNALLLCLSHLFLVSMNIKTNFIYINEIATFLSKTVMHPSKSVRSTAGRTIQTFSTELEDDISCVCSLLINSIIDSLNIESNDDIIEALNDIFTHSCNDEESTKLYFDKAFSYFLPKIQSNENMQHIYPSFVALCATSRIKSREYFDQIFEINNAILESTDQEIAYIQNYAVDGLKNLAIMCSENFTDKIPELITYFTQIIEQNSDNTELIMEILSAIGHFISKFSKEFDFPSLIPFLTKIVEDNDEPSSLALSTICSIMDEYIEKVDLSNLVQDVLQYFQLLNTELISNLKFDQVTLEKPVLNLLRAMTIFIDYIDKLSQFEDKVKNKSDLFDSVFNWVLSIVDQTDNNYIISEAISVLTEIVSDYTFDSSALSPLIEKVFAKEYDDDLFPTFLYFLKRLIQKGAVFDSFVPNFFEMANSSNQKDIRDFGLQILGQIAESQSGECINETFIKSLVESSLKNIHEFESPSAVYVINQIVTGCSKIPNFNEVFNATELMSILLNCLQTDKKNVSYLEFADNCVTSFAAIVMHVIDDAIPYDSYLQIILEKMPARYETTENFEMMHFFLWIGNKTDFTPPDLFLAVLVRFFSNPMDEDVIGFIARNVELIETLKKKLLLLMDRIDEPDSFVARVCNNDQYKLDYFQKNIIDDDDE